MGKVRRLFFLIAALIAETSTFGDVVINEVQSANDSTLTIQIAKVSAVGGKVDDDPDWVELHNNGPTAVDLSGWGFSDKASKPFKWKFPEGASIAAGGYLLLIADEREQSEDVTTGVPTRYHIPISLSTDGETLILTSKDGVYSHTVTFGMLPCDASCGFAADGTPIYYATPTPEAANSTEAHSAPLAPVTFSRQRGLFTSGQEFDLELSHEDPAAQIYYTLDHSDPDDATGAHGTRTLYSGPIRISGTTVVRATAEKTGALPYRNITSHSYIYPDQVMSQRKPDCAGDVWKDFSKYSKGWEKGSCPACYKPSENVIHDDTTLAQFVASIHAAPVVSVTMSDFAMFDPDTGLHSKPDKYNNKPEGERPASVEWVSGTGDSAPVFGLLAGLKMQGGWGRYFDGSSKKSFQLKFRKRYGKSKLQEDVLGAAGCPRKKFKSLILRAEFHDSWTESSTSTQPYGSNMKDEFWRELSDPVLGYAVWGSHVHLYVNGLYWGLYNLTEHADEDLAAEIGGGEGDDYVMVKNKAGSDSNDVISGDKAQYFNVARPLWQAGVDYETAVAGGQSPSEASESCLTGDTDMSVRANYESAAAFFDVDNLISYMHLGYMSGNWDWPANNWNVFGIPRGNVPFRWMVWDFETTCENTTDDNFGLTGLDKNSVFAGNPGHITKVLLKSPEFRMKFADRFDELTKAGGPLSTESLVSRYQALAAEVRPRIFAEAARWGSYWAENDPSTDRRFENSGGHGLADWEAERDRVVTDVLPFRVEVVRAQLKSEGVYPASALPPVATLSEDGRQATLALRTADAGAKIYFTTDGSDPCDAWATGDAQAVGTAYADEAITSPFNAVVKARARTADGEWSTLTTAKLSGTESDSWYEFLPAGNGENWSEPANWSKDEVPDAADAKVRIGVPTAVKSGKGWRNVHLDQDASVGTMIFICGGWTNRLDETGNLTLGGPDTAATVQVADQSGAGLAMLDLDGQVTFAGDVTFDVANPSGDAGYGALLAQGELNGNGKALVKTGAGKMSFGFAGATNEQALGSITVNGGTLAVYGRVTVTGAITGAIGTALELEINRDGDDTAIRDVTCATLDVPAVRLFLKSDESGVYVGGCHAERLPSLDKVSVYVRDDENGTVAFKDNRYSPIAGPDLQIVTLEGRRTYQVVYIAPEPPEPPEPIVVTTNAMAEANWGYEIHGLGETGDEVALVYTNAGEGANMSWSAPTGVTAFDFLVVGGGGGGRASGAGAGGVVTGSVAFVSTEPYVITVGAGGASGGGTGGDSAFGVGEKDWVRAYGGAGGVGGKTAGRSGGSGSGAGTKGVTAGEATQGEFDASLVSSAVKFGCAGGTSNVDYGSAGGGGATQVGGKGSNSSGNKGGDGLESFITGESVWYAGGGTGGGNNHNASDNPGGRGGGGRGGINADKVEASLIPYYRTGGNGTDGLGGGGGGVYTTNGGGAYSRGGSGVVVIRYADPTARPEPPPELKPGDGLATVDLKAMSRDEAEEEAEKIRIRSPNAAIVSDETYASYFVKTVSLDEPRGVWTVTAALDGEAVRPEIGGTETGAAFVVGDEDVSLRVMNARAGLYYGYRTSVTLAELDDAPPRGFRRATTAGELVLTPPRAGEVRFYRVVVTP